MGVGGRLRPRKPRRRKARTMPEARAGDRSSQVRLLRNESLLRLPRCSPSRAAPTSAACEKSLHRQMWATAAPRCQPSLGPQQSVAGPAGAARKTVAGGVASAAGVNMLTGSAAALKRRQVESVAERGGGASGQPLALGQGHRDGPCDCPFDHLPTAPRGPPGVGQHPWPALVHLERRLHPMPLRAVGSSWRPRARIRTAGRGGCGKSGDAQGRGVGSRATRRGGARAELRAGLIPLGDGLGRVWRAWRSARAAEHRLRGTTSCVLPSRRWRSRRPGPFGRLGRGPSPARCYYSTRSKASAGAGKHTRLLLGRIIRCM